MKMLRRMEKGSIRTWQRLRRLAGIYGQVRFYLSKAASIEQTVGYLAEAKLQRLIMSYGNEALAKLRVTIQHQVGTPLDRPGLLVGNHVSYVDIPLLMSLIPVSFVAKKEVRRFPIMGAGAARAGTIFVARGRKSSRAAASAAIARSILEEGRRVVVFPSGTTSVDERHPWRWGPFRTAAVHDLWVQPFRLRYSPLRSVAYIDRDFFPLHLWRLLDHERIVAHIEFAPPIKVIDAEADAHRWWQWSREFLLPSIDAVTTGALA